MVEFLQSTAGMVSLVFAAIFVLIGLVAAANEIRHRLGSTVQGYPHEAMIEAALLPFLDQAIMAAYRASEKLMDSVSSRLHGADKSRIARYVYQFLPDALNIAGLEWAWKLYVDEEKFATWLQKRFDGFAGWWDEAETGILRAIQPEGDEYMVTPLPEYRVSDPNPSGEI